MSAGNRIPTDGGRPLGQNPFSGLEAKEAGDRRPEGDSKNSEVGGRESVAASGQPPTQNSEPKTQNPEPGAAPPARSRGRVDITRQTAGRGGKTVTVISGFVGIGQPEKEHLAKQIQKACGAGGTVKEGRIEIQGDRREPVARILAAAGFRPVFAGG